MKKLICVLLALLLSACAAGQTAEPTAQPTPALQAEREVPIDPAAPGMPAAVVEETGEWQPPQAPQLMDVPEEFLPLEQAAEGLDAGGIGVKLAYNLGHALLLGDSARASELHCGTQSELREYRYEDGFVNPFYNLEGFVCKNAAVRVDTECPAPVILWLDIEEPGHTGLPTGSQAYVVEYRAESSEWEKENGYPEHVITALMPVEDWTEQTSTPARRQIELLRSYATGRLAFEDGDALYRENPGRTVLYLILSLGKNPVTGAELEEAAAELLGITGPVAPGEAEIDADPERYWFLEKYDPAEDLYFRVDGFDGAMDIDSFRWASSADDTKQVLRRYRDGLYMVPEEEWVYTVREQEDERIAILQCERRTLEG